MIAFIQGTIHAYTVDQVILNHQGMGWQIYYPHTDKVHLGEEITIHTYMHVTENDVTMFGFESAQEKDLFMRLIAVKGLGPKTAIGMLTKADVESLISAIEQGNVTFLKSMPGVGNRTASQIILDLKGKLVENPDADKKDALPQAISEACDALKNFGYKQSEINQAAKVMNQSPNLKTEDYIKIGLQYFSQNR